MRGMLLRRQGEAIIKVPQRNFFAAIATSRSMGPWVLRATPTRMPLTVAALFHAAMLAVAVGWQWFRPGGASALLAVPRTLQVPWWAAAIGVSWLLILGPAWLEDKVPALRALSTELYEAVQPVTRWRVAVLAGLSGICEEALFRGPLQGTIGWLPAAVLFALAHGGGRPKHRVWGAFALVAGLLFGWLVQVYDSLDPAIVAHITVNAINMRRLQRFAPRTTPLGRQPEVRP